MKRNRAPYRLLNWMAGLALLIQLAVPFVFAVTLRSYAAEPALHPCHGTAFFQSHKQIPADEPGAAGGGMHSHTTCPLCTLFAAATADGLLPDAVIPSLPPHEAVSAASHHPPSPRLPATASYHSRAPPEFG